MTTPKPQAAAPIPGRWLDLTLVVLLIGLSIFAWLAWPIHPNHARRDALLRHLKGLAAEVNEYKERRGLLPESLKDIPFVTVDGTRVPTESCPYPDSGYRLIVQPNHRDFMIVADHVSIDATGAEFHFASDGNLQIQKVPCTKSEPQPPPTENKPGD